MVTGLLIGMVALLVILIAMVAVGFWVIGTQLDAASLEFFTARNSLLTSLSVVINNLSVYKLDVNEGLDKLIQSHAALERSVDGAGEHQVANEMSIALARDLHLGEMEELRGMVDALRVKLDAVSKEVTRNGLEQDHRIASVHMFVANKFNELRNGNGKVKGLSDFLSEICVSLDDLQLTLEEHDDRGKQLIKEAKERQEGFDKQRAETLETVQRFVAGTVMIEGMAAGMVDIKKTLEDVLSKKAKK